MILLLSFLISGAFADDLVIEKITGTASDIELMRPDGWKQVPAVGAKAPQGTRIRTHSDAAVEARLPDGSAVLLGTESEAAFHVLHSSETELSLDQGRARATVRKNAAGAPRFRIKTRAATMGVRGTDFTVEVNDEKVGVHVLDGSVEVARAGARKADYVLAPRQALALGSGNEKPQEFEPSEFLASWEKNALPVELHWWQRLWRWLTALFL